jgi:hypothetical protein
VKGQLRTSTAMQQLPALSRASGHFSPRAPRTAQDSPRGGALVRDVVMIVGHALRATFLAMPATLPHFTGRLVPANFERFLGTSKSLIASN